ncbi:unnamed protein product [Orchesella dallaii]|uniref:Transmembrane protein 14C n=1 Tax=Orchesella dallaii TaxID=48710 RepID=A0ABP1PT10_9HEXA
MGTDYLAYGFAAFVAVGGVFGFLKAGSLISLGVGLIFGAILAFGAYQTSQDPSNYLVTLGVSGILAGVMGTRYYYSGKFMPAGLIAGVATAMMLRYVARSFANKSPQ